MIFVAHFLFKAKFIDKKFKH